MHKDEAERDLYIAQARAANAEYEKLLVEELVLREDLDEKQQERKNRTSRSRARRTYDFVGEVTEMEVETAVDELNDWTQESHAPIVVRLCSPGGSVFDGLFLYDFLQDVRRQGVHVTTYVMGYGASMGSILSQAGDRRLIAPNAWFMVHEPSTIALGKAGDIRREAKLMERLHEQLSGILAARSTLSLRDIIERSSDKDWWMNAQEATEFGFFDGIST